jgi:hypothetical protein
MWSHWFLCNQVSFAHEKNDSQEYMAPAFQRGMPPPFERDVTCAQQAA